MENSWMVISTSTPEPLSSTEDPHYLCKKIKTTSSNGFVVNMYSYLNKLPSSSMAVMTFIRIFIPSAAISYSVLIWNCSHFIGFFSATLIMFYKQHMIKKTSWTLLDFIQSLLIFVA